MRGTIARARGRVGECRVTARKALSQTAPSFSEQVAEDPRHCRGVNRGLRIVPAAVAEAPPTVDPAHPEDEMEDTQLVAALRAREPWAADALVRRFRDPVRRVLMRVLGGDDSEHGDLIQEVFTCVWQRIGNLKDPGALKPWLIRIAVFKARGAIRQRRRRRWLKFLDRVPEPEPSPGWAGSDIAEAARCVYRIFDSLPVDERIPYALRTVGGLDIEATADACGMSVATVRRRLVRAERRFFKLARQFEALGPWLEERS